MAQQHRADHSFAIKCQLIEEVWQWPIIFNMPQACNLQ